MPLLPAPRAEVKGRASSTFTVEHIRQRLQQAEEPERAYLENLLKDREPMTKDRV